MDIRMGHHGSRCEIEPHCGAQCACESLQWKIRLRRQDGMDRGCLSSDLDQVKCAALTSSFGDDVLTVPGQVVKDAVSLVGLCFTSSGPGPQPLFWDL